MTTIRMNTEAVRDLARQLDLRAMEMDHQRAALKSSCARLAWAWQGSNAAHFRHDFNDWLRRFQSQVDQLDQLALRAAREVDEWEQADRGRRFGAEKINLPWLEFRLFPGWNPFITRRLPDLTEIFPKFPLPNISLPKFPFDLPNFPFFTLPVIAALPKWLESWYTTGSSKMQEISHETVSDVESVVTRSVVENQTPTPTPSGAIELNGPTKSYVLSKLGGCTHYVATRRNLDDWTQWPHAHAWDDAAREAGYLVNTTPAEGAIIQFEKGAGYSIERTNGNFLANVDGTYGHVALVEQVDWNGYPDKVRVMISEGNYDGNSGSSGDVHTGIWIVLSPDDLRNISFIHGKQPGSI